MPRVFQKSPAGDLAACQNPLLHQMTQRPPTSQARLKSLVHLAMLLAFPNQAAISPSQLPHLKTPTLLSHQALQAFQLPQLTVPVLQPHLAALSSPSPLPTQRPPFPAPQLLLVLPLQLAVSPVFLVSPALAFQLLSLLALVAPAHLALTVLAQAVALALAAALADPGPLSSLNSPVLPQTRRKVTVVDRPVGRAGWTFSRVCLADAARLPIKMLQSI